MENTNAIKFENYFLQVLYETNNLTENLIDDEFIKHLEWKDLNTIVTLFSDNEKICLNAVKKHGYALQYVKNQTENICLEAIKQNENALFFVKPEFKKICKKYLKNL